MWDYSHCQFYILTKVILNYACYVGLQPLSMLNVNRDNYEPCYFMWDCCYY